MMTAPKGETIVAISTPPGRSIRALVRVSGPDAFSLCPCLPKPLPNPMQPYAVIRSMLNSPGLPQAQATFVFFCSPRSYTGEDLVEISIPGSPPLKDALLAFFISKGCRIAGPGEFTRRAFENGRINLSQAKAVLDLIHSVDDAARRSSLTVLTGGLAAQVTSIRNSLLDILFRVEANLDFADEDIQIISPPETIRDIDNALFNIESVLRLSKRVNNSLPRVVICGPPNAGKTTLFNAISNSNALVSNIPGTTTDPIKADVEYEGVRFTLWDTAGASEHNDGVLHYAGEISQPLIDGASLVLTLASAVDYTEAPLDFHPSPSRRCITVITKCDIAEPATNALYENSGMLPPIRISAINGMGISALLQTIASLISTTDSLISLGDWQYEALTNAAAQLKQVSEIYELCLPDEIAAIPIRAAVKALELFEGRDASNEVLDRIFSSFCIGK